MKCPECGAETCAHALREIEVNAAAACLAEAALDGFGHLPDEIATLRSALASEREARQKLADELQRLVERFDKAQRHATAEIIRRARAVAGQTTDAPRSPAAPEEQEVKRG